ncbi:hypothetical protein VTK26DRAFT_2254 [Humicola hyalothermophila]
MRDYDGRLPSRWACLFLMVASMASATAALSLSSVQPLRSHPGLACNLAYSRPIPGCTIRDFQDGATCSADCVRGLNFLENILQMACSDRGVDPSSILGQALAGHLVAILCNVAPPTSDKPISSSRTEPVAVPTTTSASSSPVLTFSTVRPSQSSTSTPVTRTDDESSTSTSTSDLPQTTVVQTSTPTPGPTPDSEDSEDEDEGGLTGGGSPFDPIMRSNVRQLNPSWANAAAVSLGLGLLLVLR